MTNNADTDKQARKTARQYIYTELFFIVLPFVISLFVSTIINGWENFSVSDFSLAAAMVYGQTLFRFNGGTGNYSGKINTSVSLLWQALLLMGLIISIVLYALARPDDTSNFFLNCIQVIVFLSSLYFFVAFGGLGQWLYDR